MKRSFALFATFVATVLCAQTAMAEDDACTEYASWDPSTDYVQYDVIAHEGVVYSCGESDPNAYHWCREAWAEPGTFWGDLAWSAIDTCDNGEPPGETCDYAAWSPETTTYETDDKVTYDGSVYICGQSDPNAYHWCNQTWAEPGTEWGDLAWSLVEECEV